MDWNYLFTSYEGRINRQPFWIGTIILAVIHWIFAGIGFGLFGETVGNVLSSIVAVVLLYPSLAVATKRWHDRDKSGWWSLILLIPLAGVIWYVIECGILTGTPGSNRFGPDPLGA
jgi:uncharacterized membrane protein YhaH (DUF805 family)